VGKSFDGRRDARPTIKPPKVAFLRDIGIKTHLPHLLPDTQKTRHRPLPSTIKNLDPRGTSQTYLAQYPRPFFHLNDPSSLLNRLCFPLLNPRRHPVEDFLQPMFKLLERRLKIPDFYGPLSCGWLLQLRSGRPRSGGLWRRRCRRGGWDEACQSPPKHHR